MNTGNSSGRQWNEWSSAKTHGITDAESMFRMLFERSADAILLLDPQREVFVDCNPAAVHMMRASSKEQLLLTNPAKFSPECQPDGRNSREKTHEMIGLILANGSYRFEWVSRRFDGIDFYVEVLGTTVQTGEHPLIACVCRNITDRKTGEAALRESEARFRMLFERSADAMCLFDPETGRFIESNEAATRLLGAPSRRASNSPAEFAQAQQPNGRESTELATELTGLALAKGSHRFEWTTRRENGSELPLDVVLTSLPSSKQPLLLAISRDISAQKRAEKEILRLNVSLEQRVAERTIELVQANEQLKTEIAERGRQEKVQRKRSDQMERHRDVLLELAQSRKADFEQALQTICSHAATTLEVARVSYWSFVDNNSAIVCDLFHHRNGAGAGEKLKGARLAVSDCPAYFAGLAAKRPIAADNVFTHPATSGLAESYLKPRGIASMLDAPVWMRGEMVGVLCTEHVGAHREWSAEEIDFVSALAAMVSLAQEESYRADSERRLRESEGRFSAAFRASPVFITISDFNEGRFILANEAFLKWSGYRLEEVLGQNSVEIGLWADPSEREMFWEELRRTGSIRDRECRVRSRHGKNFTTLLSADLIEISGKPHVLIVGLDITQRKQAEAELLKTLSREKELGLLRSKFVSMVSHEFRTPLGIIQSSAEILDDYLERLEAEERKEHLHSIQKNIRRMAALMEEVLLIGSFDAGKMDFKPAPVDLARFAGRLVDEVLSATDRRCPILLTLCEMPGPAQADERLLRHIFTNLLTNAVKYSDCSETVHFEFTTDGTDAVCVIRDRGIGIPDADREWLFSAFHRGQNVGERPGTGLGLVIVKRCADAHGGRIQIDSAIDAGTTVTVRLPLFNNTARDSHDRAIATDPVTSL